MKIIKTGDFQESLKDILAYIARDKKSASIQFNRDLNKKIKDIKDFPFMYRKSYYFDDEYIRDLTHKGYSIPYSVNLEESCISIIGITKYKNRLR
ncbi:type II toxin-antitoxin system RelE/ParE family toxin [Sulfurovum sp. bin170]|uniref:type II toxin-antitoxin system RelE/ParE family toxin n=1 Tax=Sulfurovum sp. bin170 TaxID=2695268 RepID=UPI0013DEE922|nr:type II toxin-antitoxin system RelE/ParE family toxin [Sulfurovum sp. bin170]NEW60862.1 type II toxin-antitoxin system RelE/ParE family toxin [Sulfurovum sp. bin170]